MKNLIILILLLSSLSAFSQTKIDKPNTFLDSDGIYKSLSDVKITPTGKYYIDKNNIKYPVYTTSTNKLFIILKSKKTNKEYRRYLKL